ncbi:hypothetical protein F3F96_07000 [Mariprofundus sp. NF]|uniref:hypothetical protein n=1 Tax=Mariprofundus sp. NF TaxID=2608716 RepID=UPI0015A2472F|nr:hypothetical protein [Mariprofundus sp. NF]NWF38881.1 hypothetical protein [Mariprofundus sp. NF]
MKHALKRAVFAAAILVSSNAYAASELEVLKNQVQQLMDRIEQLESKNRVAPAAAPQAATSKEAAPSVASSEVRKSARVATAENSGNPSISVIGNFTGQRIRGDGGVRSSSFLPLSEAEFIFGANIDTHARLDVTVTGANGGMAVEEGFITAYLPWGVNMRAGRKFLPVGRVNEMHPHALIYADRPNGLVNLFGPEIFIGDGLLLDKPLFIGDSVQTLTAGFFSTENDVAFDPTGTSQYAGLARWTGLWDIGDNATFELGANYVQGKNGIAATDAMTRIAGGHFAIKHQNLAHAGFTLEGEWLRRWQEQGTGVTTAINDGSYLLATAALNRNWHLFSRFDYSREYVPATTGWLKESAISAGLAWKFSEFQSVTLQYKHTRKALAEMAGDLGIAAGANANAMYLRWVVAIGPHGAHPY